MPFGMNVVQISEWKWRATETETKGESRVNGKFRRWIVDDENSHKLRVREIKMQNMQLSIGQDNDAVSQTQSEWESVRGGAEKGRETT